MNVRSAVGRLFGGPEGSHGPGREALQYFAASLVSLAVDLAIFSASIRLFGVAWVWAATLGFAAGVVTAYWLSITWVFSARRLKHVPHSEFMIFAGIGVAGLAFTQVVLWIGIEGLHAQPELAKLAAAGATFLFNFAIRKTVLFRGR